MSDWLVTCNGGPNNRTVGKQENSLQKAIGALKFVMTSLHASIGQIEKMDAKNPRLNQLKVNSEQEAGQSLEDAQFYQLLTEGYTITLSIEGVGGTIVKHEKCPECGGPLVEWHQSEIVHCLKCQHDVIL